jgi:chaperonin GroEL
MRKEIMYGAEAKKTIKVGIDKIADAVVTTLGPRGRNAIISRSLPSQTGMQYFNPTVTRDGVTVARNIILNDYLENVGCLMVREASEKTMQVAGDGTTTTVLLMREIIAEGMKLLELGANPQALKKDLDTAIADVVNQLKELSTPIHGDIGKIRQVATISANNDPVIGQLIADAFEKMGMEGILDIQESKGVKTEIKISEGIKFDRGWVSQYFITNSTKDQCILENPYILLYDKKIYQMDTLLPIMEKVGKTGKPLLIVCDDADGEALAALAMNAKDGRFRCCVVRAPGFGDSRQEEMEDLATTVNATYISDEKGYSLKSANLNALGMASKVVVSKDETVIHGFTGKANKELEELIVELRMNAATQEGEEKEKTEKRIARLIGGIGVIYVGANTEVEMKEKKDRVDDAIRATKAAISEGYIVGGATAFLRVKTTNPILEKVFLAPLRQICHNAGVEDAEGVISKVIKAGGNIGFNAKEGIMEDLVSAGVIDPVKVLRCALENAASAAGMILTSETLICDVL